MLHWPPPVHLQLAATCVPVPDPRQPGLLGEAVALVARPLLPLAPALPRVLVLPTPSTFLDSKVVAKELEGNQL